MVEKKVTKREHLSNILVFLVAAEASPDTIAFVEHEIELLDRKRSSKAPDAKKVAEQNAIKDSIVSVLGNASEPMKATPIAEALDLTVQRVSALLRQMVADGTVVRTEEKKVATFSLG